MPSPSPHRIHQALTGFLGTFSSRRSSYAGYWLFGFLVVDDSPWAIDLLGTRTHVAGPHAEACERGRRCFADQVHKAGLELADIVEARLDITPLHETRQVWVGGEPSTGRCVHLRVALRTARGGESARDLRVFAAPHDPTRERRSARAVRLDVGPLCIDAIRRITLRPTVPADLPVLFEQQRDEDACAMAAVRSRDRETFDAHWARVLANPLCVARVIVDDEDRVLGGISCFVDDDTRYVGYWIGKEHWGRGVASAAVALLIDEVRERPIHARVARDNVASIKVLERNGFVVIGHVHAPETERFLACEEALLRLE